MEQLRPRIRQTRFRKTLKPSGVIATWVFDLDNTLYPHHLNLWQQVDVRIRDYIVGLLKITHDEAFRLQKDYYRRYGTTLRGLMEEHGLEPDQFLEIVHQIDHSPLTPNPALGAAIAELPGRKFILTNGTRHHADAVLRRLEIEQHFDDVFDIKAAELEPKPRPQVYERFLARHTVDPSEGRDVRGSRPQSRSAACARHDHGAGGAAKAPASCCARSGNSPAAMRRMSIMSPTISPASCAALRRF